jgi:hypothetical protein
LRINKQKPADATQLHDIQLPLEPHRRDRCMDAERGPNLWQRFASFRNFPQIRPATWVDETALRGLA